MEGICHNIEVGEHMKMSSLEKVVNVLNGNIYTTIFCQGSVGYLGRFYQDKMGCQAQLLDSSNSNIRYSRGKLVHQTLGSREMWYWPRLQVLMAAARALSRAKGLFLEL